MRALLASLLLLLAAVDADAQITSPGPNLGFGPVCPGAGALCAAIPPQPATFSIDGSAHTNVSGAGATVTLTLTTALTNDDIGLCATMNNVTISSITDVAGLTWTKRKAQLGSNSANDIEAWWAPSSGTLSGDVITIHLSTLNGFITADVFGVHGASNISSPFDSNGALPAGTTSGTSSVSTSNAIDFLYECNRQNSTSSPTAGTGWTQVSGADFQLVEWKPVTSVQTSLTCVTGTGSGDIDASICDAIAH